MKRKTDIAAGQAALSRYAAGIVLSPAELRTAVRYTLEEFAVRYPGGAVEIRVPWIGAVQAISGLQHRRGTPPNVVELPGEAWLDLVLTGQTKAINTIQFSGTRADLSPYLPLRQLY